MGRGRQGHPLSVHAAFRRPRFQHSRFIGQLEKSRDCDDFRVLSYEPVRSFSQITGKRATSTESRTGVKQLVARAQPIIKVISEGFDPGSALESGVRQYPKVGVELV
jgi:hypothetical protein